MNYRHAYHAGNFADVFKHVLLTRALIHLTLKDSAFRYIDTHSGVGLYDLASAAPGQTGEWRNGVGRLLTARLSPAAGELLAPYIALLGSARPDGSLAAYPGSPAIAQSLLRASDRITLCELHPEDLAELKLNMGRDSRVKCLGLDGYMALNAFVPPRERRGLVLIDPPFEAPEEFERMASALVGAYAKWPGGVYFAWYPVKGPNAANGLAARIAAAGIGKTLRIELAIGPLAPTGAPARLAGCGLFVINPPFTLAAQCDVILPELARVLGENGAGQWRILA